MASYFSETSNCKFLFFLPNKSITLFSKSGLFALFLLTLNDLKDFFFLPWKLRVHLTPPPRLRVWSPIARFILMLEKKSRLHLIMLRCLRFFKRKTGLSNFTVDFKSNISKIINKIGNKEVYSLYLSFSQYFFSYDS